ncbi:unnamed protein product [Arabis nemorensis]|uniref:Uncharacterized protein n=1 Tax=Arabis nemorensis TaxID=586526 RepID=A0A565BEI0_9BRAS|nr:unnamed protein product [Arabis nemorensis]
MDSMTDKGIGNTVDQKHYFLPCLKLNDQKSYYVAELDGLNPELTSMARKMEIARASRQDVKQVSEMIKEYLRLERVWRHVQILMSDTKMMDMSALFWNELTTSFNIEIVPKAENTRPNSSSDEYTLRKMFGFYKGHVYKMFSRLPLYKRKLNPEKIRQYNTIMDYMTDKELDDQKPVENIGEPRTLDILRESKIGVIPFFEMLSEFLRLERVWRDVEKLMSNTKLMDMSALFWNEIATTLDADIVPEVENIPPRMSIP